MMTMIKTKIINNMIPMTLKGAVQDDDDDQDKNN